MLLQTACGVAALPELVGGFQAYDQALSLQEILVELKQLTVASFDYRPVLQCASRAVFVILLRSS